MSVRRFQKSYAQLNPNQKLAVNTTEGPLMVVAGPGTGKTQVLTLRIANILRHSDVSPDSILALTFTEAAAQEMRRRLIDLIGQPGYLVHISTFHSFCQSIIMENPDRFIINQNTQQLSDLDRVQILENILDQHQFKLIKPLNAPYLYLKAILSSIQNLKREGISPSQFKKILDQQKEQFKQSHLSKTQLNSLQRDLDKNLDLLRIYRLYQRHLKKKGRFDFEDMINFVNQKFSTDSDLLLSYQEKINYILVDEYQDTNSSQNQLIFQLASYWQEQANLFVVGDPFQSIFRFQGASLENTQQFIQHFPQATLINLRLNYRSTQLLLDSAYQLLTQDTPSSKHSSPSLLKPTHLQSQLKISKCPIHHAEFSHPLFEDSYIAQDIKKILQSSVRPQEIAVIARHNQDLIDLSETLKKENIPFVIQGGGDILDQPLIKQLILLLTVIHRSPHQHTDEDIFTLLNLNFLSLDSFQILKLAKQASSHHQHLAEHLLSTSPKSFPAIKKFFKRLSHWQNKAVNTPLPHFLQFLLQDSGLLNHLLQQSDFIHQLNILNTFFDQAKTMSYTQPQLNLAGFLTNLDTLQKQSVKIPLQSLDINSQAITLTTAHKAKGLEWSHVYIYRCTDKKWGNPRSYQLLKLPPQILQFTTEPDPNQEEKRIFYVSLTRSRQHLTITSSSQYPTSTGYRPSLPSPFISLLPSSSLKNISVSAFEKKNKRLLQQFFTPPPDSPLSASEKDYLHHLLQDFKLSVTSLNTYLTCPYKFKLNNLYRLPRTKEPHLAFGTAVHQALEDFYLSYQQTDKLPSLDFLLDAFKNALHQEILSPQDYRSRLRYGRQVLTDYYHFHQQDFTPALKTEKHFGASTYSRCYLNDIPLTGKIDRIDLTSPSTKSVRIIDYKTGRLKTRGQINGTTKDSDGSLKRQLTFYQLLSQLDKRFSYQVKSVELDFIEAPHKKQKTGRIAFRISPQEVSDLKKTITTTFSRIRQLKFPRTQDYTHCQRCQFNQHCWPQGIPQNQRPQSSKRDNHKKK